MQLKTDNTSIRLQHLTSTALAYVEIKSEFMKCLIAVMGLSLN
jgi:hypothetical protein